MKHALKLTVGLISLAMCGCDGKKVAGETQAAPSLNTQTQASIGDGDTMSSTEKTNRCAEVKTEKWKAVLNKMPIVGGKGPTLAITGMAQLNSGGWTLSLTQGLILEKNPPIQIVDFIATRAQIGTQPVLPQLVSLKINPAMSAYDSVQINCDGKLVAKIAVEVVH